MDGGMTASVVTAAVVSVLLPAAGLAQSGARTRPHTLHAKVEVVNEFAHSLRVKQEKIAGYSDARVMTYNVDDPGVLKKLEVGDEIVATIYEKDDTQYDIRIVRIDDRLPPSPRR